MIVTGSFQTCMANWGWGQAGWGGKSACTRVCWRDTKATEGRDISSHERMLGECEVELNVQVAFGENPDGWAQSTAGCQARKELDR